MACPDRLPRARWTAGAGLHSPARPFSSPLRSLGVAAVVAVLAGCATGTPPTDLPAGAAPAVASPTGTGAAATAAAGRVDPAAALRCMDQLLAEHGARDLTLGVEPVLGDVEGAGAGARDVLLTALSSLGTTSRALRVLAWERATRGAVTVAPPTAARLAATPETAVRGTLRALGSGAGDTGLELDLALLRTQDLTQVAGTGARNSIRRDTSGKLVADLQRLGLRFDIDGVTGPARSQALGALAALSAVELVGRWARVPYWTCLGVPVTQPAVVAEVQDWYDGMAARPAELIAHFQQQLQLRRAYDGPVDGAVNPALKEAVARARETLGLSREPKLSVDFYRALLVAARAALSPAAAPSSAIASPVAPPTPDAAVPLAAPVLALRLQTGRGTGSYVGGEAVDLLVSPSRDAHVYCYHEDENRQVVRFFPNRFQRDARVRAGAALALPGAMRFQIVMNPRRAPERIACFATTDDVLGRLPPALAAGDFAPLPPGTFDRLAPAFTEASAGGTVARQTVDLRPR